MRTATIFVIFLALSAESAGKKPPFNGEYDSLGIEVMSFNVRYGTAKDGKNSWQHRRDLVSEVIRSVNPDLIGMQEALRFQLDEIRTDCEWLDEIGHGRDDGRCSGEYSAILYRKDRFRCDSSGTFWFSETPHVAGSRHWGNRCPRICTWARFVDIRSGTHFYMYNAHLDHWSNVSQKRSMQLLCTEIQNRRYPSDPVIVTGDFNAGEKSQIIRSLSHDKRGEDMLPLGIRLVDSYRSIHPSATGGTLNFFLGYRYGPRIDYIFVQPGVQVLDASIVRTAYNRKYPSDHFPIRTRVKLR